MIRCEVIREFTLEKFDELKNIVRAKKENNIKGKLFVNDTFECEKSMADYLMGNNEGGFEVVKIIEYKPKK